MYLAVGALCGVMAFFFEWSTGKSRESFKKLADAGLPVEYHPLVGSAIMCATALFIPETLFLGYKVQTCP
jgi:H+/Cl- antiporter ClcA